MPWIGDHWQATSLECLIYHRWVITPMQPSDSFLLVHYTLLVLGTTVLLLVSYDGQKRAVLHVIT